MIPLRWDEIVALGLGELRGEPPADGVVQRVHADSRVARPGDLFVALNTGVRYVDDALARGAAALVPTDQHAALAVARLSRSVALGRTRRGSRRLDGEDVDEGRARRALRGRDADGVRRGEPEQRDRPAADRAAPRAGDARARHGDGDARARADRRAVRDRAARSSRSSPRSAPSISSSWGASRTSRGPMPRRSRRCRPAGSPSFPSTRRSWSRTSDVRRSRYAVSTRRRSNASRDGRWRFHVGGRRARSSSCRSTSATWPRTCSRALTAYDALGLPLERAQEGAGRIEPSPWRGELHDAARGRLRRQRRLQREPDLDARRAARSRRARRRTAQAVAVLGEMAELGGAERPVPRRDPDADRRTLGDRGARGGRRACTRIPRAGVRRSTGSPDAARIRQAADVRPAPATPCSSRPRAQSGSKASPRRSRRSPPHGESARGGPGGDGDRRRHRPTVHRLAAPGERRPADPRGRAQAPRRQAGDADDGRAAHPVRRGASVRRRVALHDPRADRDAGHPRLRDDRVRRRLPQGAQAPLARAVRPLEAAPARRRDRRRWLGDDPGRLHGHRDLLPGDRRQHRPALVLLPVPVHPHRGNGERRQPHGRPRRARRGHVRGVAADAARDRRDHLDPVGARRWRPQRRVPRPRDRDRGADRRRDRLPLVQRLPGRGVHGRHRLDGARRRDRDASRSSPRRRCCSSSSAAST